MNSFFTAVTRRKVDACRPYAGRLSIKSGMWRGGQPRRKSSISRPVLIGERSFLSDASNSTFRSGLWAGKYFGGV